MEKRGLLVLSGPDIRHPIRIAAAGRLPAVAPIVGVEQSLVRGVVGLLHGGTDPASIADRVTVALCPVPHSRQIRAGARPVVFLDEETERERPCLVALAMYGFSAFSRAARFLALTVSRWSMTRRSS